MSEYRCNGCGHQWSSEEEPFSCPECSSTNFEAVEGKKSLPWKKIGIGAGILALIVLLVQFCSGDGSGVEVSVTQDNSKASLHVELNNYQPFKPKEFKISLKKDGVVQEEKKTAKTTFSDLEGTYTLEVRYIGKETGVVIGAYKHSYTFPEKPRPITILSIKPDKQHLRDTNDTYTITVEVDDGENAEYQLDGGDWQKSNTFKGLKGDDKKDYIVVVRNGLAPDNTSLYVEKKIHLNPYKKAVPLTKDQINALLREIANYNDTAYDQLVAKVGAATPVVGAPNVSTVQDLANAVNNGTSYTVTEVEYDSNRSYIVSIRVR